MVDSTNRRQANVQLCPGFCGRVESHLSSGSVTYSHCQACGWGYRSIDKFLCSSCKDPLSSYDWLYLTFVTIIPLLIHCFFIHFHSKCSYARHQLAQYICCIIECSLSTLISVLLVPPRGSFTLYGCPKSHIREWYTLFYNPVVNHTHSLHCANEIVFPLYSLPFIYFAFIFFFSIALRSFLYLTIKRRSSVSLKPYYAALFSLPVVALCHSLLAGILYYTFPYITLLFSLGLNVVHMALQLDKTIRNMCVQMLTRPRNLILVLVHMALFGFSLFSIQASRPISANMFTIVITFLIIPLPFIFYVVTVGITYPGFTHSSS